MKQRKKWIAGVVLLLLCCFAGFYYWNKTHNDFKEESSAVSYSTNLKKPKNFKNQIALPGFSKIVVKKGDGYAKVALSNPSFNEVYLKYTVKLSERNKELLKTEAIPPGKAVKGFVIPTDLKVGEHKIEINIKSYDVKTKKMLNGGTTVTKLVVIEK